MTQTPSTAAGKALLRDWDDRLTTLGAVAERIAAIEQEARAESAATIERLEKQYDECVSAARHMSFRLDALSDTPAQDYGLLTPWREFVEATLLNIEYALLHAESSFAVTMQLQEVVDKARALLATPSPQEGER